MLNGLVAGEQALSVRGDDTAMGEVGERTEEDNAVAARIDKMLVDSKGGVAPHVLTDLMEGRGSGLNPLKITRDETPGQKPISDAELAALTAQVFQEIAAFRRAGASQISVNKSRATLQMVRSDLVAEQRARGGDGVVEVDAEAEKDRQLQAAKKSRQREREAAMDRDRQDAKEAEAMVKKRVRDIEDLHKVAERRQAEAAARKAKAERVLDQALQAIDSDAPVTYAGMISKMTSSEREARRRARRREEEDDREDEKRDARLARESNDQHHQQQQQGADSNASPINVNVQLNVVASRGAKRAAETALFGLEGEGRRRPAKRVFSSAEDRERAEQEAAQRIAGLISMIPSSRAELLALSVDWATLIEDGLLESKIKPWVASAISESLGEAAPVLEDEILSQLRKRAPPMAVTATVAEAMGHDFATPFVARLFRELHVVAITAREMAAF